MAASRYGQEMHKTILEQDMIPETKEGIKTLKTHEKWRQEPSGRGSNWSNIKQYEYKKMMPMD